MADNETSYLPIGTCLEQIEKAVYGREVRKAIHDGIAQCYDDTVEGVNAAQQAASDTQEVINNMTAATTRANNAAAAAENVNATASKVQDGPYQITVTNSQGTSATIEIPDPDAEVKKKANLEAVTVKKTVGPAEMVSFEDGVDAPAVLTKIKLEPKQDLHGYDHPWVGGAGKNLFSNFAPYTTVSNDLTYTFDGTDRVVVSGTASGTNADSGNMFIRIGNDAAPIHINAGETFTLSLSGQPTTPTFRVLLKNNEAGTIFFSDSTNCTWTFTAESDSDIDTIMFRGRTVGGTYNIDAHLQIEIGDTATSYEPYSNICPIEGYEEVTVYRTGTNLLSGSWCAGTSLTTVFSTDAPYNAGSSAGNAEWRIDPNGVITLNKDNSGSSATYVNTMLPELPAGVYYSKVIINGVADDHANAFVWDMTTNSRAKRQNGNDCLTSYYRNQDALEFVVQEGHKYQLRLRGDNGYAVNGATFTPMLLISDYINYVRPELENAEIQITEDDGAVYGGELTLNEDGSGTVAVDRQLVSCDGTENWEMFDTTNRIFQLTNVKGNNMTKAGRNICSIMPNSIAVPDATPARFTVTKNSLRVSQKECDSVAAIKAWLSANPCEFVIFKESISTTNLTATQVQTLVGTNHVWTDASEITLTYRSDKYAELERRISQLEALVLES